MSWSDKTRVIVLNSNLFAQVSTFTTRSPSGCPRLAFSSASGWLWVPSCTLSTRSPLLCSQPVSSFFTCCPRSSWTRAISCPPGLFLRISARSVANLLCQIFALTWRHVFDTLVFAGAVVCCRGDTVEQHRHWHVAVCHMPDWGLWRAGHQPPGEPAVCQHNLSCGPRCCAKRVWGCVCQWCPLHRGVWRMPFQRCRHCGEYLCWLVPIARLTGARRQPLCTSGPPLGMKTTSVMRTAVLQMSHHKCDHINDWAQYAGKTCTGAKKTRS